MPVSLSFNPDQSRTLDRKVRRIDVSGGSLLVTETDNPVKIDTDQSREFDNTASLTLYSPNGANVAVYYFDEQPEVGDPDFLEYNVERAKREQKRVEDQDRPTEIADAKVHQAERELRTARSKKKAKSASRGDTGGKSGSFESRTTKELRVLAKERKIAGYSAMKKRELIKALRG